jgi:hypothetical protein
VIPGPADSAGVPLSKYQAQHPKLLDCPLSGSPQMRLITFSPQKRREEK